MASQAKNVSSKKTKSTKLLKVEECDKTSKRRKTSKVSKTNTKNSKPKKSSKNKEGEVSIYGGVVKCGVAARTNWIFSKIWRKLDEYGDQECADEEAIPPKFKNMKPTFVADNWRDILKDATTDLHSQAVRILKGFELPERYWDKTTDLISSYMGNVEKAGYEVDEMMREYSDDDYEGDSELFANSILRKMHYGIFVQICWGMNAVKDYLRTSLEKVGYPLAGPGEADKEDTALFVLKLLEDDEIGKGEYEEFSRESAKLVMLQYCPFNDKVIEFCYLDDKGTGPIIDVAREAQIDIAPIKKKFLAKIVGDKDLSSEKSAKDYRCRLLSAAKKFEIDASEELEEVDDNLVRLDQEYRTVDGREFTSRKEAEKQRELSLFEASLDLSSEEAAVKARNSLLNFIKKLGIDGSWKLERVDREIERFDLLARTVRGMVFDTREEAVKQRELDVFEKNAVIKNEESAIKLKSDLINLAGRLGVDGEWALARVNGKLACFDKLARTAFKVEYATREEAAEKRSSQEEFFSAIEKVILSAENSGFYHKDVIPPKKLSGSRSYLSIDQDDGVIGILDTTIFGSAKTGLVVSRWGIVWKNDVRASKKSAYSWDELSRLETDLETKDGDIIFGKESFFVFSGSNGSVEDCCAVLQDMVLFAKESTWMKCSKKKSPSSNKVEEAPGKAALLDFSCSSVFTGDSIPEKKRSNAFVSMKVREPIGAIIALVDSTVFGSAKEGLVITNRAVYFKNIFEDPVRFAINEIETVSVSADKIKINGVTFCSTGVSLENLKKIGGYLESLLEGAK